jgi:hypothetical protein
MQRLRILHLALCTGALLLAGVLLALRSTGPATTGALPPFLGWSLLGFAALGILSGAALRTSVPPMEATETEETWAVRAAPKCIPVWAAFEGAAIMAMMALYLGANPWVAGGIAAVGLGLLASQSPGTLGGH